MKCCTWLPLVLYFFISPDDFNQVIGDKCDVKIQVVNVTDEMARSPCARQFYYRPDRYQNNAMEMYATLETSTTCPYRAVYYRWRFHRLLPTVTVANDENLKVDVYSTDAKFNFFDVLPALELGYIVLNATVIYDIDGINASFSKFGNFLLWSDYWEYSGCDVCFILDTLNSMNINTDFLQYKWCHQDLNRTRVDTYAFDTVLRTSLKETTAVFKFEAFAPNSIGCDSNFGSCIKVNPGTSINIKIINCTGIDCPKDSDIVRWRFYGDCLDGQSMACQEIITEEFGNINFPETFSVTIGSGFEGPLVFGVNADVKLVTKEYLENRFVVKVNEVPSGSCEVKPLLGYQNLSSFNVYCSGYGDDPDSPIDYKFFLNCSSTGKVLLQRGTSQNLTSLIFNKTGDKTRDYEVCIKVIVSDVLGLTAKEEEVFIQVRPSITETEVEASEFLDTVNTMLEIESPNGTEENNFLTEMITAGDVKGAMTVVSVISTALSESVKNDSSRTDTEKIQQRMQIRESVINSMRVVPIDTVTDIELVTTTLNTVTETTAEVTEKAMDEAADTYLNLVGALKSEMNHTSEERAENVTLLLLEGSSNLLIETNLNGSDYNDDIEDNRGRDGDGDNDEKSYKVKSQKIKKSVGKILQVVEKAADNVLDIVTPDTPPKVFSTSKMDVVVAKSSPQNIAGTRLMRNRFLTEQQPIVGSCLFPNDTSFRETMDNKSQGQPIGIQFMFYEKNPFTWDISADSVTTPVMDVILKTGDLESIETLIHREPVQLELSHIGADAEKFTSTCNLTVTYNSSGLFYAFSEQNFIILKSEFDSNDTRMITITSNNIILDFTLYVTLDEISSLEIIQTHGFNVSDNNGYNSSYTVFDIFSDLNETNSNVSIGITPVLTSDFDAYAKNVTKGCNECSFTIPFEFTAEVYTVSCIFWNSSLDMWSSNGCTVSNSTTRNSIYCECSHLTAFSGGLFVMPNVVDPFADAALFLTFFSNPVVVATVIIIWIIYLLFLCWARKRDRRDQEKTGVIVVEDNSPDDTYVYEICVFTAWWRHAGTTATVSLFLNGEDGQSAQHCLNSAGTAENVFESGSEDWFIITTPRCLGKLHSLTVWHDNSGKSPSWSLSRIIVTDAQTNESWNFPYGKWIAVDMGSMSTKVTLPSHTKEDKVSKGGEEFAFKSSRDLRDQHLWISIVSKPSRSTFTRVQRLSCGLSLLLTTMLTNIMFHGIPTDQSEDQLKLGGIRISLADIVIGIESSIIMFPINLIILQIFMRINHKPDKLSDKQRYKPLADESEPSLKELKIEDQKNADVSPNIQQTKAKRQFLLPWWFLYVGWLLVICTSLISSYFVMLYGLKYGLQKSIAWLVSFFTAFLQSAIITQPLKVICVAVIVTMILKKPSEIENQPTMVVGFEAAKDISHDQKGHAVPHPLTNNMMKTIRKDLLMKFRIKQTFIDMALYLPFVAVVLLIVHGHKSVEESYRSTKILEDTFVNSGIDDVKTGIEFWDYYEEIIKQNLKDTVNVTSDTVTSASYYHLVGSYRLRQLRMKQDSCSIPEVLRKKFLIRLVCNEPYSMDDEDRRSYNQSWNILRTSTSNSNPWTYRSAWELETMPFQGKHAFYSGGGYVVEVIPNSDEHNQRILQLQSGQWLDEWTRALFIEFTLFNPSNNLFSVVIILFEFTNIGVIFPYYYIATANLYRYDSKIDSTVIVSEIIFVIYTLIFTYTELKKYRMLGRRAYFREFWNYVEIFQIILSYVSVGLSFQRIVSINYYIGEVKKSGGQTYISIYPTFVWDYTMNCLTAILVAIVILKIFKVLKFSHRIYMIVQTLYYARELLLAYMVFAGVLMMGFAHFAFLTFGYSLFEFKEFKDCLFTLFNFTLGISDFTGVIESNRILGPFFCFLFAFYINILFLTIFVSIMNASIRVAKEEALSKHDLMDAMWLQMSKWISRFFRNS